MVDLMHLLSGAVLLAYLTAKPFLQHINGLKLHMAKMCGN
jgi:hypothetical protein